MLAAEENDLAAARDDAKAVRLQLKQVHKELLNLAQAQPAFPSGASTVGGRLGLLPSRIRARPVRKKAEEAVQFLLDAIRQSEWSDQRWFLETYTYRKSTRPNPSHKSVS